MNFDASGKIVIQLSKSKLFLLFLGAATFAGIGFWFIIAPPKIDLPLFGNPTIIFIVGLACIVFFGIMGYFIFKMLGDKSPGLVISAEGVFDNSSAISVGLVPWTDILEIKETKVVNQTFISLIVKNPQDYIDKQTNPIKGILMQKNYDSYGTAIAISVNGLSCDYQELKETLDKKFMDFKSNLKQ